MEYFRAVFNGSGILDVFTTYHIHIFYHLAKWIIEWTPELYSLQYLITVVLFFKSLTLEMHLLPKYLQGKVYIIEKTLSLSLNAIFHSKSFEFSRWK